MGALGLAAAFTVSLGIDTALATCGSPSVQLTGGSITTTINFSNVNNGTVTIGLSSGDNITYTCTKPTSGGDLATAFQGLNDGSSGVLTPALTNACTVSGKLDGWRSGAATTGNGNNTGTVTFTSTTATSQIFFNANVALGSTSTGGGTLATGLSLKTVCVGSAPTFTNQEFHNGTAGGSVIDWKKGASDPVDPTVTIGTWAITGNQVTYVYTAGGSYNYTVWNNGNGTYDFCNGTSLVVTGTIKTGQVAC